RSRAGRYAASISAQRILRIWQIQPRSEAILHEHTGDVMSLAFSLDGSLLASGGRDGRINLWSSQQRVVRRLSAHQGSVWKVAFAKDGAVASTGADGVLRIQHLRA